VPLPPRGSTGDVDICGSPPSPNIPRVHSPKLAARSPGASHAELNRDKTAKFHRPNNESEKKPRFLSRATIQRPTICTAAARWRCGVVVSDLHTGAADHRLLEARPRNARLKIIADGLPRGPPNKRRWQRCKEMQSGKLCVRVASADCAISAPFRSQRARLRLAMAQPSIERMLWRGQSLRDEP
jgi:hypothetical protein